MTSKYEFTGDVKEHHGRTLRRIRRMSDGKVGGWIEQESNLSQEGKCWVSGEAMVYGNAQVCGDARVLDYAQVWGGARVYGHMRVGGHGTLVALDAWRTR